MESGTSTTVDFGPLRISYDDRVLAPRPWTIEQSRWAAELAKLAPEGRLLELCCGAGQIGLATISAVRRRLVCVDVDPVACEYTRLNADLAGLGGLLEVRTGPIEDRLLPDELFAGIIADPPWVPRAEVGTVPGGSGHGDRRRSGRARPGPDVCPGGGRPPDARWLRRAPARHARAGRPDRRPSCDDRLRVAEVREFERGVLVRLDRS